MLLTIFFGPRYQGRLRGCVSMHTHCLVNRIINKHCDIIQQSKGNQMRILEPKNCIQRMPTCNSLTHLILIHRQVTVSLCELGLLNKELWICNKCLKQILYHFHILILVSCQRIRQTRIPAKSIPRHVHHMVLNSVTVLHSQCWQPRHDTYLLKLETAKNTYSLKLDTVYSTYSLKTAIKNTKYCTPCWWSADDRSSVTKHTKLTWRKPMADG